MKNKPVGQYHIPAVMVALGWGLMAYSLYIYMQEDLTVMSETESTLESQVVVKKSELRRLQDFVGNIERIKDELRELNAQLDTAMEHMPPTFDMSGLLRQLTNLANNSGVEISSFKPQVEERAPDSFYGSIVVQFNMSGSFTQILTFLDQLSRLKRIVQLESVDFTSGTDEKRSGGVVSNTLATLRTYRFAEK